MERFSVPQRDEDTVNCKCGGNIGCCNGLLEGTIMANVNYQDQGFCGTDRQSATEALNQANRELHEAVRATPEDKRPEYRSQIRWEGDGYAWYWLLRE